MKKNVALCLICVFAALAATAGEKPKRHAYSWNSGGTPFEQKVFIENKGQYNEKDNGGKGNILFSTSQEGLSLYWNKKGLTYRLTEHYVTESAKKEAIKKGHPEEILESAKKRYHYLNVEWVGCNANAEVVTSEEVSHYYTFKNPNDKSGKSGLQAQAYKKIIYKNIYPGIDIEYTLPEKGGVKYSFIVHPGADLSIIKIKYSGADKISKNAKGEIEINANPCGNYLEHLPETFYEDGTRIASNFTLKNNIIGFEVPGYDNSKALVIDPWVSVVNFPNTNPSYVAYKNQGYDVAYDNAGNVWVYGGGDPLYVGKYSNTGALLWIFQVPLTADLVGDFDVNKVSGTAYVCEGYNGAGAGVVKISTGGIQQAQFFGSTNNYEMSRIRFDCAGAKLYTTGGGVPAGVWQVCGLDTNLAGLTGGAHTTASPNGDHDVNLMTLDPVGGFMYVNFNYPAPFSADYMNDNEMQKIATPAFVVNWIQPGPIYNFIELGSIPYAGPYAGSTYDRINMFNGMVATPGFLYTYDGAVIKKWNKNTGAMITSVATGGTAYASGGLDVDLCENVYAGVGSTVKVYNSNLMPVTSYPVTSTTYDLKVDNNTNQLYVTGNGFVSATAIPPLTFSLTTTSTSACGICNGTATANMTNTNVNCNATINYSYLWLPGGQTTQNVNGLCSGTYTVIVDATLACAKGTSDTAYVTILNGTPITVTTGTICTGQQTATLTATGATTYSWSPPTGLSGTTGSVVTANPPTTTVYTITANGNCVNTTTVTVNPVPTITVNSGTICAGQQTATLTAGGAATYTWSPATGLSSTNGTSVIANPTVTTNYTVSGTNASGCIASNTTAVTVNPVPTLNPVASIGVCDLAQVVVQPFVSVPGGATVGWTNNNTAIGLGANGVGSIATFTGTSGGSLVPVQGVVTAIPTLNGCVGPPINFTITIAPKPSIALTSPPITCPGQNVPAPTYTINPNDPAMVFAWVNNNTAVGLGANGTGIPPSFTASSNNTLANITSVVTVTPTLNGCVGTPGNYTITIYPTPVINPIANVEKCPNVNIAAINFSVLPGGGNPSFGWANSNTSIGLTAGGVGSPLPAFTSVNTGNTAQISSIIVSASLNGCPAIPIPFTITIDPNPVALFSATKLVCVGSPMSFTDQSSVGSGFIAQWAWNLDASVAAFSNAQNPQYVIQPAGTHSVTLSIISDKGCVATVTEPVYINYIPLANYTGGGQGCPILTVNNFTDVSSVTPPAQIVSWSWNFGNTATSTNQSPGTLTYGNPSPVQNAVYSVSLLVSTDSGCVSTNYSSPCVTVYPHPLAGFSWGPLDPEPDIMSPVVYLFDQSVGASGQNGLQWYLGDIFLANQLNNYTNVQNPIHSYDYPEPYIYYVTQWVQNSYGCRDSLTKPVEIKPNWTFYIPNAFSPNGDGVNEGFKGTGIGIDLTTYNLWIFDRWGMMIFYSNDLEKTWDGKIQGKNGDIVQEDVYVWKVRFSDFTGKKHEYKGTVSVVK